MTHRLQPKQQKRLGELYSSSRTSYLYIHPSVCLSFCLCLSVCTSVCLSVGQSVGLWTVYRSKREYFNVQGPLTALVLTFSSKTVNRNMKHEAAQKQTKVMNDKVEKQGVLKMIIYKACKIKVALAHLSRDGKRGYLAFRNFTAEKKAKIRKRQAFDRA